MPLKPRPDLSGERPGLGRFAAQGAVRGAENLASLVDFMRSRFANEPADVPGFQRSVPLEALLSERVRGFGESRLGPRVEPEGFVERAVESGTAGAVETLPTLPAAFFPGGGLLAAGPRAAAGTIARRAGADLASGVAGETARSVAEREGLGGVGQGVASMAGSLGTTGIATRVGQAVLSPVRNRTARSLARQALGREVRDRRRAIRLLQQEIDAPLFGRATTDQVLQGTDPGVVGIMKRTARSGLAGSDLRRRAAEIREFNTLAAAEEGRRAFPVGSPSNTTRAYQDLLRRTKDKVSRAYRGIGDLDGIPTTKIKAAAAFVATDAGDELSNLLPKRALRIIEGYGDTVSLRSLQRLRRSVAASVRKAQRRGDSERIFYLNKLADSLESTFDEVAELGGAREINALRRARLIRSIEAERFDPRDPLNQVFDPQIEDMGRAFDKFLRTDKAPTESLRRLRLTMGDDPEAWGGVQRLMRDRVFGEDFDLLLNVDADQLTRSGANRALKNLRKLSSEFDAVYGSGASRHAEDFIRRSRQLSKGVVGKVDEFAVTGSNVSSQPASLQQVGVVADIARGDWTGAARRAFQMVSGRLPKTIEEADVLLAQAMVDPHLARGFLEELPAEAVDLWQRRARNFLSTPARSAAGAVDVRRNP